MMDQGITPVNRKLFNIVKRAANVVVDAALPARCPSCRALVCGAQLGQPIPFCASCFSKIQLVSPPYCMQCGWPKENEDDVCLFCRKGSPLEAQRFAMIYGELTTKILLQFKHGDRPELARRLATWMMQSGYEILQDADLIVPVPIHWQRLWKRQYNQAAELSRYLSRGSGVDWDAGILKRHVHTKPQGHLSPRARLKNVSRAFDVCCPHKLQGKHVVLVDDVITTGATVDTCARALLKAGALRVDVLAVAAVPAH